MRILHCIDTLGAGGAERQLVYLARGLDARGHEVEVAYLDGGAFETSLRKHARLHRLRRRSAPGQLWELSQLVNERKPDVVQTWLGRMNVLGALASVRRGVPWIYSERSLRLHDRGLPGAARSWLGARASLLIANSEAGARLWRPTGARVAVVPNGVPVDEIAAAPPLPRRTLGLDDDAELIVWAGRLVAAKNVPLLAQVLGRVVAERPRTAAIICGEGELAPSLRPLVAKAHGRVQLLGQRDDLWNLLKTASLLLSTSLIEGRPNVVLEAMAARLPLVLSDIAPHRELAGDGALFFDVRGPAALDQATAQLGRVLDERTASCERAERAFAQVQNQSIDAMVQAHLAHYRRVVDGARPGPRARARQQAA